MSVYTTVPSYYTCETIRHQTHYGIDQKLVRNSSHVSRSYRFRRGLGLEAAGKTTVICKLGSPHATQRYATKSRSSSYFLTALKSTC
jgi:hypothetical protein